MVYTSLARSNIDMLWKKNEQQIWILSYTILFLFHKGKLYICIHIFCKTFFFLFPLEATKWTILINVLGPGLAQD